MVTFPLRLLCTRGKKSSVIISVNLSDYDFYVEVIKRKSISSYCK